MKRYRKSKNQIYAGVQIRKNKVRYNFKSDNFQNDIIYLYHDNSSEFNEDGVRYIYAYTYSEDALESEKVIFRNYIKNKDGSKGLDDPNTLDFIQRGVLRLENYCNFKEFGATIHINSKSKSLVNMIGMYISEYTRGLQTNLTLIKNTCRDVEFDEYKAREAMRNSEYRIYTEDQIEESISKMLRIFNRLKQENQLFEMKKFVPRELRYGFTNFLKFKSRDEELTYKSLQGTNVLIYDDFLTSGSTIREAIRYLRSINDKNTLTIFVLVK